jgi:putative ABC transport system ATP-binding protein
MAGVLFEIERVTLARADRTVLDGVCARLPAGACAIAGPSGCGKSTLLRLLNRLADPDAGSVSYRGRAVAEYPVLDLRRDVALVPQLPALLDGTVAHNVEFAARLCGRPVDVQRMLELVGLDGSFGSRDASKLSVGEQQRVMLARAIGLEPSVLLLDEPTAALDQASRDAVEATLLELRHSLDVSLVIVTHDLDQADRLADSVLRLERGQVTAVA